MEPGTRDDPYAVLGVRRGADEGAVRRAYRARARALHPDLNAGSAEDFKRLASAYEILGGADRRRDDEADTGVASPREPDAAREVDEWKALAWLGRLVAVAAVLSMLVIGIVAFAVGGGDGSGSVPGPELTTMCQTPDGWVDCRALDPGP